LSHDKLLQPQGPKKKRPTMFGGAQYAYATLTDTNQRPSAGIFGHPTLEGNEERPVLKV
jgi:hypothetical protein